MSDKRITSYASKQITFDKSVSESLTVGESAYYWVCLTPLQRWYLLTLCQFYEDWVNRWTGGWTDTERIDLVASTTYELEEPMACQEDIQALVAAVQGIGLTMQEIRDKISANEEDVVTALENIATKIDGLGDPSDLVPYLDDLEEVLDGVGTILGAAAILG